MVVVELLSDAVGVGTGGTIFGVHVCEFGLDELVVGYGLVELSAGVGVGKNEGESGGHDSIANVSAEVH